MKLFLITLAALFTYDLTRFLFTVVIKFVKAYQAANKAANLDKKIESLSFYDRLRFKNVLKNLKKKQEKQDLKKVD